MSSGRGELRSPAGDHWSPLQIGMLIVKNIKFYCFSDSRGRLSLQLMGLCEHCAFNRRAWVHSRRFFAIRLLKASPLGRGGAVRRRRGAKPHSQHTCHPVGANCVRPREHQGAPLQIIMLIVKNIKFHYFFGQSRTPVPTILEFLVLCGRAQDVRKIFLFGSFCGAFFKKRP